MTAEGTTTATTTQRGVHITNEIIITAMDRFVWFVLLVVMSHLVTEFTRVSGYARGQRQELVLLNDTLLQPMPVQNMVLYPSQEYGQYQQRPSSSAGSVNSLQQNAALLLSSLAQAQAAQAAAGMGAGTGAAAVPGSNGAILSLGDVAAQQPAHTAENTYPMFSLRPLIDSIFEIPISTLRAVNNLVGRLTGSYRSQAGASTSTELSQKSVAAGTALPAGRPPSPPPNLLPHAHPDAERHQMREEMA